MLPQVTPEYKNLDYVPKRCSRASEGDSRASTGRDPGRVVDPEGSTRNRHRFCLKRPRQELTPVYIIPII